MRHKRAQEEIFGFMILIVMIVIIGLIFLTFYKPKQAEQEQYVQTKIDNLLYSIVYYNQAGQSVKSLAEECYYNVGCDLLRSQLKDMLNVALEKSSMAVGKQIKGYSLEITETEISLSEGQLEGNKISSVAVVSTKQDLEATLSIYY